MNAAHHHPDHTEPNETPLDAWHRHTAAEGLPREEHGAHANVKMLMVIFVVLVGATLVFSGVIGVYTLTHLNSVAMEGERAGLTAVSRQAREYRRDALAAQSGYGWTESGSVKLPIDQAMSLVVQERAGGGSR